MGALVILGVETFVRGATLISGRFNLFVDSSSGESRGFSSMPFKGEPLSYRIVINCLVYLSGDDF
jgi:hypothetical protein